MTKTLQAKWRGGIYREVIQRRDKLIKRYVIPHGIVLRHPPWQREEAALQRVAQLHSDGLLKRRFADRTVVIHQRDFLPGTPLDALPPDEAAQCLATLHQRGVVCCDPHPENFIRRADQQIQMIDFGRAVVAPPGSLRHSRAIGCELDRLYREAFDACPNQLDAFLTAYRAHRPLPALALTFMRLRLLGRRLRGKPIAPAQARKVWTC